jgi:predicted DNA-binding transcriptional regulator
MIVILQSKTPLPDSVSPSSAVALGALLGVPVMSPDKLRKLKVVPDFIINWGLSSFNYDLMSNIINHPISVVVASNKLKTLEVLSEPCYSKSNTDNEDKTSIPCVEFTSSKNIAVSWLKDSLKVVCRRLLRASQGRGIEVVSGPDGVVPRVPLYTKYVKHRVEFRVHVVDGEVILIQRKYRLSSESLLERGILERDLHVRNVDNGYVYSTVLQKESERHSVNTRVLSKVAVDAVSLMGLDFGAVDIIVPIKYSEREDPFINETKPFVLEINTAPGLGCEESLQAYARALLKLIRNN